MRDKFTQHTIFTDMTNSHEVTYRQNNCNNSEYFLPFEKLKKIHLNISVFVSIASGLLTSLRMFAHELRIIFECEEEFKLQKCWERKGSDHYQPDQIYNNKLPHRVFWPQKLSKILLRWRSKESKGKWTIWTPEVRQEMREKINLEWRFIELKRTEACN